MQALGHAFENPTEGQRRLANPAPPLIAFAVDRDAKVDFHVRCPFSNRFNGQPHTKDLKCVTRPDRRGRHAPNEQTGTGMKIIMPEPACYDYNSVLIGSDASGLTFYCFTEGLALPVLG